MIVESRDNGRVTVSMADAELNEMRTAQHWYKDHKSKITAKANKAVAKKVYKGDIIIGWILKLNDFCNRIIERHKQYAWNKALREAERDDR